MTTPTIRDQCAALAGDVDYLIGCVQDGEFDPVALQQCADDMHAARDALAAEAAVGDGPSLADVNELCAQFGFHYEDGDSLEILQHMVAAALARWGHPATPPAPEVGEVGELVAWMRSQVAIAPAAQTQWAKRFLRIATLLSQLSAPARQWSR